MYVVTDSGVVLLDTPWDTTQFQPLLDSIEIKHQQPVILCIATHFHDDRTAGLHYFSSKGIPTWSSAFTKELCVKNGEKIAENIFINDTTFKVGGFSFETFYPGEGHTPDNIVIWIPELKILYGGCFVKSIELKDLGNLADANIESWPLSIQKVLNRYPDAAYIIPGHFDWSKKNALKHTLKLIRKN
jgi:glyoxylase-like metal-dependent hydrolase (beta-lactamase superfamily II)